MINCRAPVLHIPNYNSEIFITRNEIAEAAEADDDATPVRMQPSSDPSQMAIAQDPNHTPMEGELDFEEATDEALEAQAKWGAQQALLAAQERTKTFDAETKELQQAQTNIALNQSDCKYLRVEDAIISEYIMQWKCTHAYCFS